LPRAEVHQSERRHPGPPRTASRHRRALRSRADPGDPGDPAPSFLFVPLPPPTDYYIEALLRAVCRRVLRIARRFHVNELTLRALERELGL